MKLVNNNRFVCLRLLVCLFICGQVCSSAESPSSPTKWHLVDSFDFDRITTEQLRSDSAWLIDDEPENLCQGENIYQYSCHRMANVAIRNGSLEIGATVNPNHRNSRFLFNTGKVSSTKSWKYGKFVMRAKLPEGKLLRSVFVLKPAKRVYNGSWLDNGQINALVYAQQSDAIIAGLNYRMDHGQSYVGRKFATKQNVTKTFHLYTLEWTNTSIRLFFDDVLFFENTVSKPFDQPFYFVLQLGVGGPEFDTRNIAVQTTDSDKWHNRRFVVDYIKVYQDVQLIKDPNKLTSGTYTSLALFNFCAIATLLLQLFIIM